jgi:hypothetical protein
VTRRAVDLASMIVLGTIAGLVAWAGLHWAVGVIVALAYFHGGAVESMSWRRLFRNRARADLERFTEWAESALASVPDDLDPEQEAIRDQLRRDYQAAQTMIGKLKR